MVRARNSDSSTDTIRVTRAMIRSVVRSSRTMLLMSRALRVSRTTSSEPGTREAAEMNGVPSGARLTIEWGCGARSAATASPQPSIRPGSGIGSGGGGGAPTIASKALSSERATYLRHGSRLGSRSS
jgi:hypothetical protein